MDLKFARIKCQSSLQVLSFSFHIKFAQVQVCLEYKMFYSLALLFLSGFAAEAFAENVQYRAFAGLNEQVMIFFKMLL